MKPVPTGTWAPTSFLPGAALRQSATEHVTLRNPERPTLGAERGQHAMEDPGQQLVEIQRRAELQADRVEQPEALYLVPELFNGAFGGAEDIRHGIGTLKTF